MSLSTYSDLTAAVADYLARSDLTSVIPTFITLTEVMAQFGDGGSDIEPLRVREMEASVTLTPDANGNATLPTDFLEIRRVTYNTDPLSVLTYLSPADLNATYGDADADSDDSDDADTALNYTILGSTLTVRPIGSGSTVTLDYYQKIPALTSTNTTNWLMTKAPTVYLYGCLFQSDIYTQNPAAGGPHLNLYRNAILGLERSDRGSKAASFVMRVGMPAW